MSNVIRPGRTHYATATKVVAHGAPCVEDGFAGKAIKKIAAPGGTGLGSSLIPNVQISEKFHIECAGEIETTNPGGAFAVGDAVYIVAADNSLRKTQGLNEVQLLTIDAGGGTYTITFSGQTTAAIAFDATAVAVQAALVALSNVAPGDVVVTGAGGGPYTVTFGGAYAATDVPAMTTNAGSLTGGAGTATVTTPTGGQASTAGSKFGRVTEIAPARGLTTGLMRVNMDDRDTL